MKKTLLATAAILAVQAPVHALVGIGVSGGLNTTSISAKTETISGADLPSYFNNGTTPSLTASRGKVSGLTQVGVKAWLELPLLPVEFELGTNLAWGSYKSGLFYTHDGKTDTIPVDVPSPLAGFGEDKGSTPYASLLTDLTIRYPLLKLPPVLNTLKLYVGAGVTHVMATRVIDKKDIKSTFSSTTGTFNADEATNAVKDELLQSTFGGHLSVGAQVKIPVIPIALYVDGKWYMNAAISDAANKYPFTVNAGLGFAL
jgi:hypothetical protein